MQLDVMKIFCDILETKSFSKAASLNFLTQSAVSQKIRSLEARFNRQLIERGRHTLVPTEAGLVFYRASKDILERYQELEGQLRSVPGMVAGVVRVTTAYSIGLYELPPYIKRFLSVYPNINVQLEYGRTHDIYASCVNNQIDFGIVAYPQKQPQIQVLPFRSDKLVFICSPRHPLAHASSLGIRQLQGQKFVGFEKNTPTHKSLEKILKADGVEVDYVMGFDNIETLKRAVEIGIGVSIVPEPTIRLEVQNKTLKALSFNGKTFLRPIVIILHKGKTLSPAAQKFIDFLTQDTA